MSEEFGRKHKTGKFFTRLKKGGGFQFVGICIFYILDKQEYNLTVNNKLKVSKDMYLIFVSI